jgi:hypothetical protein
VRRTFQTALHQSQQSRDLVSYPDALGAEMAPFVRSKRILCSWCKEN